jgi:hypothetical protein
MTATATAAARVAKTLSAIVLAAALVAGCDDKKPTPKVEADKPAMPSMDAMKEKAAAAADATKDAAAKAMEKTKDAGAKVAEGTKDMTASAVDKTKTATADAPAKVADATATGNAMAADWVAKLEDAIKANKLDEAKTYMDKLESVKANLPENLRQRYEGLKVSYEAAKAKVGAGLPAVPQLNK